MATPVPVVSIMYFLVSLPPKMFSIVSPAFSAMSVKSAIRGESLFAWVFAPIENKKQKKSIAQLEYSRRTAREYRGEFKIMACMHRRSSSGSGQDNANY